MNAKTAWRLRQLAPKAPRRIRRLVKTWHANLPAKRRATKGRAALMAWLAPQMAQMQAADGARVSRPRTRVAA